MANSAGKTIATLAFDADDTLWHTERFFQLTQAHFEALLAPYYSGEDLNAHLLAAERRNIGRYGFGVKGFVLSMIETALEVTGQRVPGSVISEILKAGQDMLAHPIELLPGVGETLTRLHPDFHMIIITKGDLLDQERKIAQSGLRDLFANAHVVSDKSRSAYARILEHVPGRASGTMMIGNSMKSDIWPALDAGAHACFIPQDLAWDLEHAETPLSNEKYFELSEIAQLPDLLGQL